MVVQSRDFQRNDGWKDASVDCSTVICFSFFTVVLPILLPSETRPTWAYPAHYLSALASSVLLLLLPLARLAVRSARSTDRAGLAAFPCSATFTKGGLGPLSTPAVRHSRRAIKQDPNLTACLLARALSSLLRLVNLNDACEHLISLTMSPDSSAAPDETTGLATLSGRLQTRRRYASCACFRGIPVAKHRAESGFLLVQQ